MPRRRQKREIIGETGPMPICLQDTGYIGILDGNRNSMPHTSCLNCSLAFKGNYCPNCGQKASVGKLSWKALFDDLMHFFTHAEHSFVYTTRNLVKRPGFLIREYLDGKRVKVHKPVTFLLIWLAILKLLQGFYDFVNASFIQFDFPKSTALLRPIWHGPKNPQLEQATGIISIVLVGPLMVLLGWLIFRRSRTSFIERWVIILYGVSMSFIVSTVLITSVFLFRLLHLPISSGWINDYYFVCYFLSAAWMVLGFERAFRPPAPRALQVSIAAFFGLVIVYADIMIWYFLYWITAPR